MNETKSPPEGYVLLGRLGKTFQLAGGLRFYPLGDAEALAIADLKRVFIEGIGESDLRQVRQMGAGLVVYFTRALTVEAAKRLVNHEIYAPAEVLPEVTEDDFYLDELLERPVFLEGEPFGTVIEVLEAGFQYILVVQTDTQDVMLPFPAPYVRLEENGVYLEDLPEGLLDLNA
jgi:16S rRNA processing protein RimM